MLFWKSLCGTVLVLTSVPTAVLEAAIRAAIAAFGTASDALEPKVTVLVPPDPPEDAVVFVCPVQAASSGMVTAPAATALRMVRRLTELSEARGSGVAFMSPPQREMPARMRQVSNNLGPNLQQFKTFIITFWMRLTASATLRTDFRPYPC